MTYSGPLSKLRLPTGKGASAGKAWILLVLSLSLRPSIADVVINEIHYAPDVKTEHVEFIELYNSGTNTIDLSSWSLKGGIEFAFPIQAALAPDGYLVIAQDPIALGAKFGLTNALGPWLGRLSNQSDKVVLENERGQVVDEVEYQLGFPWPTVGDRPGHSIELVNPGLDNDLGGSWRSSSQGGTPIPGKTILPIGSVWKYFKGTSAPSSPAAAWSQPGYDDSGWDSGPGPIGFGSDSIETKLDDMRTNYTSVFFRTQFVVDDPNVADLVMDIFIDDGINLWLNGTNILSFNLPSNAVYDSTASESIDFGGYVSVPYPQLSQILRAGTNVLTAQVHNVARNDADFGFDVGFRSAPGIDSRGATPGAKNSTFALNIPPQVRQVHHEPEEPRSGESVVVRAKVTDPDGVSQVILEYQVNAPGRYIELNDPAYETNWVAILMQDNGQGADLFPGDAVYSGTIPAAVQVHRNLIRYRITVRDGERYALTVPYPDDPQPNFAYFVYDGVPAWSGAIQPKSADPARSAPVKFGPEVMRKLPVYQLISKKTSVEQATWPKGAEQYWGSDYPWRGTLVYDGKVYDHVGFRARGGSWRYSMGKNMWKIDFNRGHDFEARDNYGRKYQVPWRKLNLGACIQQADYLHRGEQGMFESVGFRLFNLAGVESPETHFVQLRIIDEAAESIPENQFEGDFWGLYLAVEQEDGRFLDQHKLPDGNLYKMEGGTGTLSNLGPAGPADRTDLGSFMSGYRANTIPSEWWRAHFDLERYYSYQAIVQGIHHYDICAGKNYYYFLNPETQLWSVHPWDIDLTWANNMYDSGCGGADEIKNRVVIKAPFKLEFQNRVREIRDLLFNTNQTWRLIDEYAAMIDDPTGGPGFVDADRAMWDYNPVMTNARIVFTSKAGQGRFYQIVPTKDFPGMVNKMKQYVVTRGAILDNLAFDELIPTTPIVTCSRSIAIPANRLDFRCSSYAGANPFATMKWRLAEVTPPDRPPFDFAEPVTYEIDTIWESPPSTTFNPAVTIPGLAVKAGHFYRVRAKVQDNTGRWSHWSDPIEFVVSAPESPGGQRLIVTELMFNPIGGSDYEFIELHNASLTDGIDLTGARFTRGIDYVFPSGTSVPPGGYLLVVRASSSHGFASFRSHYGLAPEVAIVGPYSGSLNNDGEQVTLTSSDSTDLANFNYSDGRGWPLAADGAGHSLVLAETALNSSEAPNLNYPGSWRASTYIHGSPGAPDPLPLQTVVLNEIAAHTDFLSEIDSNDWIELYNPSDLPIDLGADWFLSDDAANLKKWQIPKGMKVSPHSWIAFDEATGAHSGTGLAFGLNRNGEQLFLSHLPDLQPGGVVDCLRFKAQENDWSLGRFPDGTGPWMNLNPRTCGGPASAPPSHLVLHEIMYHPKAPVSSPEEDTAAEYIEIYNPTDSAVSLFNTNGVWRLDGGVEFFFPPNTTLASRALLVVVSFNPSNGAALSNFEKTYGPLSSALLAGPFSGKLDNSSDRLTLEKPQDAGQANSPPAWVVVDEVIYSDRTPWPSTADGQGSSLQRRSLDTSGNDVASWCASIPTPGLFSAVAPGDQDQDGMPDDWERVHDFNPDFASDALADSDGDGLTNLQEFQSGTDPRDAKSVPCLSVDLSTVGKVVLRISAAPQRIYSILVRESFDESKWQILKTFSSAESARTIEFEETASDHSKFYCIKVELASP